MAIIKEITNNEGITCSYWRIFEVKELFPTSGQVMKSIVIHGYKDKEWRQGASNRPARDIPMEIVPIYNDQGVEVVGVTADMSRADIYEYLKSTELFSGAIDDN